MSFLQLLLVLLGLQLKLSMVVMHRILESFQLIVHLVLQLCVQQVFVLELFVQLAHVLCLVLQVLF